MKKVITAALLILISPLSLANQEKEVKFNVIYNIEKKKIIAVISEENIDQKTKEECESKLANGKESKKFESITKNKIGIVKLIYFCRV